KLLRDLLLPDGAQRGSGEQRLLVFRGRPLGGLLQQRLQSAVVVLRQLVVVPRGGRVGRQRQHIGQVDARRVVGAVHAGGEVEDLREQDHAIEVDVVVGLQIGRHHRR